jgi:cytochrome c oxidase subunit 1
MYYHLPYLPFSVVLFLVTKIAGIMYNETWAQVHFWLLFIGANLTFLPMHWLGFAGCLAVFLSTTFAGWNFVCS